MATASPPGLQQPPPLDFDNSSEWPAWILHFDDYRYASGLNERPEEARVRTLLYTMGRQARDIFAPFNLSAEDSKKFELVKKKFDDYFIKESNVVYESACFHKRHQMPGESIDQFMTALHVLVDKCDFGEFKQRLIKDRFVVGLRDEKLSESLQMDPKLSLATALARARLKETVQQQQEELRNCIEVHEYTPRKPCEYVNVDAVGYRRKPQRSKETRPTSARSEGRCIFCGGNSHPRTACPARGQRYFNCGLKGHFGKACLKMTSPRYQRKAMQLPCLNIMCDECRSAAISGTREAVRVKHEACDEAKTHVVCACPCDSAPLYEYDLQQDLSSMKHIEREMVLCVQAGLGCQFRGELKYLKHHYYFDCRHGPKTCDRCGSTHIPAFDLLRHTLTCPRRINPREASEKTMIPPQLEAATRTYDQDTQLKAAQQLSAALERPRDTEEKGGQHPQEEGSGPLGSAEVARNQDLEEHNARD
ncbi:uncharacterized protein [Dermacentor albipictus]|uniref:uncharacterized protein n=1 Tax=Dermacentor albipictus TaxID=60249 RepID=UPI0038FC3FDE